MTGMLRIEAFGEPIGEEEHREQNKPILIARTVRQIGPEPELEPQARGHVVRAFEAVVLEFAVFREKSLEEVGLRNIVWPLARQTERHHGGKRRSCHLLETASIQMIHHGIGVEAGPPARQRVAERRRTHAGLAHLVLEDLMDVRSVLHRPADRDQALRLQHRAGVDREGPEDQAGLAVVSQSAGGLGCLRFDPGWGVLGLQHGAQLR